VSRLVIPTSGATALTLQGNGRDLAITPDGTRLVYRGTNQLLVRALDQLEPTVLRGLGAPRDVFVSPDGQWVGFFDGNSPLKKVAITGGPAVTLPPVDGGGPRGATWGEDGAIVYATNATTTGLQRVSSVGGEPTVLTTPNRERGEADHVWPEFLPGGQAVLFTITATAGGLDTAQVAVFDLRTGTSKTVLRGGHHAHYVPTGHLVYGANGTLRAVAFDLGRLEPIGTPVPVLDAVVTTAAGGVDATVGANGTLVYVPGGVSAGAQRSLVWVDRTGREEALPAAPVRIYWYPRISPDGTRLALDIRDQENDIWIWDLARQTLTRLTIDPAPDQYPVWTPDSRRIVFDSQRAGAANLYRQAADGTGAVERLTESANAQFPTSLSPDGTTVILRETVLQTGADLMALSLAPGAPVARAGAAAAPSQGLGVSRPLIQTRFAEVNGEVSPDGRWLAYQSDKSGREEIYVHPFPDVGAGQWQVSTGGGRTPLWARSGRELFYRSAEGAVMGVRVEEGSAWRHSPPTQVVPARYWDGSGLNGRTFDIAPDGRRFLMIKQGSGDEAAPQNLIVVLNFFEELKRLLPARQPVP
jgi:serine/threonine-protein kinase